MTRIWGHFLSLAVTGLVASAVIPACATNDQSIFIRGVIAPPQNRQNGTCIYTDDAQQALLFQGTFDVGIKNDYFAVMLVGSHLIQRGDPTNGPRAESNRAHLDGAIVRVTETNGDLIHEFTSPAGGFTDTATNNTPDYGLLGTTVIDAATRNILFSRIPNAFTSPEVSVLVNIKAFGRTLGGEDLESAEFQFPVTVCNGCLISFSNADDPATPAADCDRDLAAAGGSSATLPCNPGQDEGTPCQLCRNEWKICNTPPAQLNR